MKFFRETTTGKVVIMGRKTLESFPNGLPLKNRTNIVLTQKKDFSVRDAVIVHSVAEALAEAGKADSDDVYVIGGESVYRQMLEYCSVAHVTKLDYTYEADTFFPNLDEDPDWVIAAESEEKTCFDVEYRFLMYVRKDKVDDIGRFDV